jgi:hypothetical protein
MVIRSVVVMSILAALAGCGEFEVRSIVLDLRVLAIQADPPEVVIPVDLENPPEPGEIDIPDIEVCALVADPGASRSLAYVLGACAPTTTSRCDDPERPYAPIARGEVLDPEEAGAPVEICGTLRPDLRLYAVVEDAFLNDALSGFGGLIIQIELIVFPAGESIASGEYAIKRLLLSPELPPGRVANENPSLDDLMIEIEDGNEPSMPLAMPLGRCNDVEPYVLAAGETINFVPVESEGARQEYVLPTFEGGVRTFTENLTYSWYATAGRWQREISGGPRDVAGNDPPLDSEWHAPENLDAPEDVRFWVVQRDERGGLSWYETCVSVQPAGM